MAQPKYQFRTQPFKHQHEALRVGWDKPEFAYLMEMGTGKSKVLTDNIGLLYWKDLIDGAVIIAPKGVVPTWVRSQLPQHLADKENNFKSRVAVWEPSPNKKNKELIESVLEPNDDLSILIFNVEAFSHDKAPQFLQHFCLSRRVLVAIDESTTIKNPDAKRTKTLVRLGQRAAYKRILSGQATPQSPLDVYAQSEFLRPYMLGFKSYFTFRMRYAVVVDKTFSVEKKDGSGTKQVKAKVVVAYRNIDELAKKVQAFSYRALKQHCLDLPKQTYVRRYVELTPEQARAYEEMKEYAFTELSESVVSASVVITKMLRLHQIVCGFVTDDDGNIQPLKENRTEALLDTIEEIDGKVIVWATYKHNIRTIAAALAKKYGREAVRTFYGETPKAECEVLERDFQDPKSKVRFMVGTPAKGKFGLTLTICHTAIYYSNSHNLEDRDQSEQRIHRIGQTNPVTYIDLECEDTVDGTIIDSLITKTSLAAKVQGDPDPTRWLK